VRFVCVCIQTERGRERERERGRNEREGRREGGREGGREREVFGETGRREAEKKIKKK